MSDLTCPESVAAARPAIQPGGGGSTPTSGLWFHAGHDKEAAQLVNRFHYSRRWPSNVQFVGTFHVDGGLWSGSGYGDAVAAVVFSIPGTRWSEPVLELSRLVRDEARPRIPLSRLIKLAGVYLKRDGRWDLLVSFADWTHRHHGGVYQAAGWHYAGMRDRQMDGLVINGSFRPGRSCNSAYGTRAPDKVRDLLGPHHTVEPHYDEGKHLYWRALNDAGRAKAERLGLKAHAYPKPGKAVPS